MPGAGATQQMKMANKKFVKNGGKKEEKEEKANINPVVLGILLFVVVGSAVFGIINAM